MMTDRSLVSVVTGTWQRHALLKEAVENIEAQTYPRIEHVIVSDGPDSELRALVDYWNHPTKRVPLEFVECGRHWTGELSDSYAAAPFMVGQLLARGAYACLWADDERATDPDHLTKLVNLLESSGADFVYPIVECSWKDEPERHCLIWADPPVHGSITHWLYRPSMIDKAGGPYRTHVGRANDWEFIERAMQGGATWAFLPEITFTHRADV